MQKEITIKIPVEVEETLELFLEALQAGHIETTKEELATILLTDWCSRESADQSTFGARSSEVCPLTPERIGKSRKYRLDTDWLYRRLKSEYMMENLSKADEKFREKIWEWQRNQLSLEER